MSPETGTVTQLLSELREGSREAESKLLEAVYQELHRIAERYMRGERADHTLQATALVNEAYLRLLANDRPALENRKHFFGVAAQVMRRILVDYARAYRTQKRGGEAIHLSFEDPLAFTSTNAEDVLALDDALTRLAKLDPRQARIVELRYYVGLTEDEISELLSISPRTVKRDWRMAKAWLHAELRVS